MSDFKEYWAEQGGWRVRFTKDSKNDALLLTLTNGSSEEQSSLRINLAIAAYRAYDLCSMWAPPAVLEEDICRCDLDIPKYVCKRCVRREGEK